MLICSDAITFVETTHYNSLTLIINGQLISVKDDAPSLTESASPQFSDKSVNYGFPAGVFGTIV